MENYNGLTMLPSGDGQNVPTTMNHPAMSEGYTHDPGLEFDQVMLYVLVFTCPLLTIAQASS